MPLRRRTVFAATALVVALLATLAFGADPDLDLRLLRACRGIPGVEKVVARFDKEAAFEKTLHEVLVLVTVNDRFPKAADEGAAGADVRFRAILSEHVPKKHGLVVFQDPRGKVCRTLEF